MSFPTFLFSCFILALASATAEAAQPSLKEQQLRSLDAWVGFKGELEDVIAKIELTGQLVPAEELAEVRNAIAEHDADRLLLNEWTSRKTEEGYTTEEFDAVQERFLAAKKTLGEHRRLLERRLPESLRPKKKRRPKSKDGEAKQPEKRRRPSPLPEDQDKRAKRRPSPGQFELARMEKARSLMEEKHLTPEEFETVKKYEILLSRSRRVEL